jgi:hypothetical protein
MAHALDARTVVAPATETCRLVILDRDGTEVLVVPEGDRMVLPSVAIPPWQRLAESLAAAVKSAWGQEIICLFTLEISLTPENGERADYQVAEHWRAAAAPQKPILWEAISGLSEHSFADHFDYSAITRSVAKCRAERREPTGPFARLGWFANVRDWVENAIAPRGLHLSANFRQLNASPSFSLVRFETGGQSVWFKAVGEPNRREFAITCLLAELFPSYLPPLLAIRPDWNAWLAGEIDGANLGETQEVAMWEQVATALATLQIESMDHTARVIAAGARDQRANALADRICPFAEVMATLMQRQTKVPPAIMTGKELLQLGDRIQSALDVLSSFDIPDALGHSDLNPWNIIVSRDACAFLDWAEAYVGNPFFSLQYLLEHFRHTKVTEAGAEARIIESYCRPWRQVVASAVINEALGLAPLLAVFAYAVGTDVWTDEKRIGEAATAGYLRSLTRRMSRENTQLGNWRNPCLQ